MTNEILILWILPSLIVLLLWVRVIRIHDGKQLDQLTPEQRASLAMMVIGWPLGAVVLVMFALSRLYDTIERGIGGRS